LNRQATMLGMYKAALSDVLPVRQITDLEIWA